MNFCKCGCGFEIKEGFNFKHGHNRKGKPCSEKHKERLRYSNCGKKRSEETKRNLSKSHMGLGVSENYKDILRERWMGENNPNFNRPYTKEEREVMRQSHLGYKETEEHKRNISINNARYTLGTHLSKKRKDYLSSSYKGKTWEELYGKDKAERMKAKLRKYHWKKVHLKEN